MAPHILRQPARDILRSLAAKLVLPRKRREENAAEFHTAIAAQWLKCVADGIPTPTYWWTADMLRWHREVQQLPPEPDDAKRQEHLRRTKLLSAEQSRSTLLKEARDHRRNRRTRSRTRSRTRRRMRSLPPASRRKRRRSLGQSGGSAAASLYTRRFLKAASGGRSRDRPRCPWSLRTATSATKNSSMYVSS